MGPLPSLGLSNLCQLHPTFLPSVCQLYPVFFPSVCQLPPARSALRGSQLAPHKRLGAWATRGRGAAASALQHRHWQHSLWQHQRKHSSSPAALSLAVPSLAAPQHRLASFLPPAPQALGRPPPGPTLAQGQPSLQTPSRHAARLEDPLPRHAAHLANQQHLLHALRRPHHQNRRQGLKPPLCGPRPVDLAPRLPTWQHPLLHCQRLYPCATIPQLITQQLRRYSFCNPQPLNPCLHTQRYPASEPPLKASEPATPCLHTLRRPASGLFPKASPASE
mmetsp:Transcript_23576/g.61308  ORF Transcript_23576/g.61308 Transcript_23576/m.61308 type:complete len:277 (-) Transcript_23576:3556-4386(-)